MIRAPFTSAGVALALLVALAPAAATAGQRAPRPTRVASCGIVAEATPHLAGNTRAEVLKTAGVSCAKARRVVRRCIDGSLGRSWVATSPDAATLLVKGRTRVAFHTVGGTVPDCVGRPARRVRGLGAPQPANLTKVVAVGSFGPFEEPNSYPDRLPPPFKIVYEWNSPVTTNAATIPDGSVSTVDLAALVRNVGSETRSAWFEWGPTEDMGTLTDKQPVPLQADGAPVRMTVRLSHLRAGTRFWWRAGANFRTASGGTETRYGVTGSFVTNPYPRIADPGRPCRSAPASVSSLFELSESLAIACVTRQFARDACFPACAGFYSGSLTCDKAFPRNLNAGTWSFPIPKVGISLSVDNLVNYWRSNNSNRFVELPGKNKGSPGGDVGPVPGSHNWDVAQWAYPGESTNTTVDFWINCTEKWGGVADGSALAAGDGGDRASLTAPGVPSGLVARAAADGGIDVSWKAPASSSPSGLAGYTLMATGWRAGEPRVFPPSLITPITTTRTSGHIAPANVAVVRKSAPPGYDLYVAVASISREGSVSAPATLRWP